MSAPEERVSLIAIMPVQTRKHILEDWNNTDAINPVNKSVTELIEEQIFLNRTAIAAVEGIEQLTYNDLGKVAQYIACSLVNKGVKVGEPVGIFMSRSLHWLTAILGILKAGGTYVPAGCEFCPPNG